MITQKTALIIDQDNRLFKQKVETEIKRILEKLNKLTKELIPHELGKLWEEEGLSKTVILKFFGTAHKVKVKLRKVKR
jgi:hypothetical protein